VTIFGELSLILDKVIFLPMNGNIKVQEKDKRIFSRLFKLPLSEKEIDMTVYGTEK
jgi:hypothetical protein